MRILMKILTSVLIISLLSTAFISCKKPEEGGENGENIKGIDISEYTIVRSSNAKYDIQKFVTAFKKEIKRYTKADLTVTEDYLADGQTADTYKEIVIGDTNRAESQSALAEMKDSSDNAYVINASENKIVIAGKTDSATIRAMKYFLITYVSSSADENYIKLEKGTSYQGTADLNSMVFDNFTEISTIEKSSVYTPQYKYSIETVQYPTMIRLCHNGENNGTLLATFQSAEGLFGIHQSTDDGKTWSEICEIREDSFNKGYDLDWGPFLYELPKAMGEFPEGTLILAATSKNDVSNNFTISTITLYASTDLGKSWRSFCNVDTGGGLEWGVWEPFLIYEEERSRLYCFYSDDSDPDHDQKLVYKYTTDLKTWVGKDGKTGADAEPKEALACKEQNLRPGMVSIAEMGNGEYFMTFELDNMEYGYGKTPIYYKKTTDLDNWGDISDYGKMVITTDGKVLGTSPWCAWTPSGGEKGTLVVVARWKHAGTSLTESDTDMFISFDYGETFTAIENPITYVNSGDSRCGYSPCLIFSEDGRTLYYLNNPLYGYGKCYEIILAKVKIW